MQERWIWKHTEGLNKDSEWFFTGSWTIAFDKDGYSLIFEVCNITKKQTFPWSDIKLVTKKTWVHEDNIILYHIYEKSIDCE